MIFLVVGVALPTLIFPLSPAILAEFTPLRQRGAMLAINNAVGTAAGIIAPFLMGSVIERAVTPAAGYDLGFAVCGGVTLVGGLIGLLFLRPEAEKVRLLSPKPATSVQAAGSV
jgi:MFS family permease